MFTRLARKNYVMPIFSPVYIPVLLLVASLALVSCSGNSPANLGVSGSGMAPCPSSPNCVSSDALDSDHRVFPLMLAVPAADAWPVVRDFVSKLPRTRIVHEKPGYLHAECRSALLGFVDDLELDLRSSEGIVAIRSASRLGYSDFGVNRRRVEALRALLISRRIVQ
jgi:uncharacterized protein (DUF1499 family)